MHGNFTRSRGHNIIFIAYACFYKVRAENKHFKKAIFSIGKDDKPRLPWTDRKYRLAGFVRRKRMRFSLMTYFFGFALEKRLNVTSYSLNCDSLSQLSCSEFDVSSVTRRFWIAQVTKNRKFSSLISKVLFKFKMSSF